MSFNRNSDYRRNKNTADIVYAFANGEEQRFRKTEDGRILLIHTDIHGSVTTSEVPKTEMTVAQFDELKKFSDANYHEIDKRDVQQARNCVSLNGIEDAALGFSESPEEIVIRMEEEREREYDPRTIENGMAIIDACLTEKQKSRYLRHYRDGLSTWDIAKEEGSNQKSVLESIQSANKKIEKFKKTHFSE